MAISIDNKKISEVSWSKVDKTDLRNKLIDTLNSGINGASEAIHECYAVTKSSNLKEAPSENLSFPHHVLEGNTLILSKEGCFAALAALNGARHSNNLTPEQLNKALSHIRKHYENDLKLPWPEDQKTSKSYIVHLEPELNSGLENLYVDFFSENGIPSKNKCGAVFDLCRSLPFYNRNDIGIRPEMLNATYKTIVHTLGDLNHQREKVIGSTIKSDLVQDQIDQPIVMRICAVFWKDRLLYNDVESIAQQNGFSMEILFSDWEYLINGQIYSRSDKPDITENQVDDLINGVSKIYDSNGNHVILLAGTLEKPIEFSGFGLIVDDEQPADPLSDKTYLEVANQKGGQEMNYTEEQLQSKIAEAVAGKQTEVDKMQKMMDDMKQQMQDMQKNMNEMTASMKNLDEKCKTTEASLAQEKERADKAEGEIAKQVQAKLVEDRKQVLASKNYELDEDDTQFIANASAEEFDKFVKRIEKVQATAAKTFEAKASSAGYEQIVASFNLTGGNSDTSKDSSKELPKNFLL